MRWFYRWHNQPYVTFLYQMAILEAVKNIDIKRYRHRKAVFTGARYA